MSVRPATLQLRDGRRIEIRAMRPDDAERLVRFHESLSSETVRLRFFSVHPHLSPREVMRFTQVDHHDREARVAVSDDEIVGVGRYERLADSDRAEVAFVVADAWQGNGVGAALLRDLVARARREGIHVLVAETLQGNRAMLAVFAHAGLAMRSETSHGVVSVELTL